MHELKFVNKDATPRTVKITCDIKSIEHIAAWYGAYFDRDRYDIFLDGKKMKKDINGEIVG